MRRPPGQHESGRGVEVPNDGGRIIAQPLYTFRVTTRRVVEASSPKIGTLKVISAFALSVRNNEKLTCSNYIYLSGVRHMYTVRELPQTTELFSASR